MKALDGKKRDRLATVAPQRWIIEVRGRTLYHRQLLHQHLQSHLQREPSWSCKSQWNSRHLIHQHHLQSHLHCGNDPFFFNSLLQREQVSVHFVHIADWEDYAHIAAFGDSPAQWTVYCVQFPRSRTFHLDTAAWNCHLRVDIPWQPTPHLVVYTATPIPFHCTNPNCIWFAIPYGPNGQYLISHRFMGTFLYNQCIVCFCLGSLSKHPATRTQQQVPILNFLVVCLLTMKATSPLQQHTTGNLKTPQDIKLA